jgi:uncharacterized protein YbjT (DUF2867 family)
MFVVVGVTGKVGGVVATTLLDAGLTVRAVVRNREKGEAWAAKGCEVAVAETNDADSLAKAFKGATGLFLMVPPNYDPEPGFPHTREFAAAIKKAIVATRPGKAVYLSTVGAHIREFMLLNNSRMIEEMLKTVQVPVCLLRAAWFMENAVWDVEAAKGGKIPSFLQPLDHRIPMVATVDIGRSAARQLQQSWTGRRVVELEGPQRYSANDIGAGFAKALGRAVQMEAVPRNGWEALFQSQGMKYPMARIRMIDGFNEGWVEFEGGQAEHLKGGTTLDEVLADLSKR